MFQKFKTKDLVVCALFGTLGFVLAFIFGSGIIAITGIPATGGLLNIFITAIVVFIGINILRGKFGSGALICAILSTLAVPTIIIGPPGIIKIIIGILFGLTFDIALFLFRKTKFRFAISGASGVIMAFYLMYLMFVLLDLPEAGKMQPLLLPLTAIYAILGAVGSHIGFLIYDKKLKDKAFIKQMQE